MSEENIFYQRLIKLNQLQGKTFNQVEQELDLPYNAFSNYRNGRLPSAARLLQFAHYYGVSPSYLLGDTENMESERSPRGIYRTLNQKQRIEMLNLCEEWFLVQKAHYEQSRLFSQM